MLNVSGTFDVILQLAKLVGISRDLLHHGSCFSGIFSRKGFDTKTEGANSQTDV